MAARKRQGRLGASVGSVFVTFALALLAAGTLHAQPNSEDAEASAEPRRRLLLPVARVTGVRTAELPEDPSSFSTVIDTRTLEGEEKNVEDVLARSVGVQVRRFGGPGQRSEVSIRGSSSQQVVVMLDGVRLNTAQSGTVDLSTVPLAFLDRIEVSRGGGSAWAGSGAIGGVVNLVTRRAGPEPETSAAVSGGSFGTWEGSVSHRRRLGKGEIGLAYRGFHTDGDWKFQSLDFLTPEDSVLSRELRRINSESESHALLAQGGLQLGEGVHVRASDHVFFATRGQPGPDARPNAPDGSQSRNAHERRFRNLADVRIEVDAWPAIAAGLSAESVVSYLFERSHFRDPMPPFGSIPFGSDPIDIVQKNRVAGWRSRVELERKGLGIEHIGAFSLDLRYESLSSDPRGPTSRRNPEDFHRRYVVGFNVQDELAFFDRRIAVIPGIRFDHTEDQPDQWMPHLGLIVRPRPWLRLKANGERSYRTPAFDELYFPDKGFIRGNPGLRPEKAWSFDVGVEVGFAQLGWLDDVKLQAVFFYQDIQNQIVWQRISPETVAPTNTDDAEVIGLELAGELRLLNWIGFSANWTLQDADLDRPQVPQVPGAPPPLLQPGSALPGRAENELHLRLQLGPASGLWKLVGERIYTSEIHVNTSQGATLDARTVYDLSASLDLAALAKGRFSWLEKPGRPRKLLGKVSVTNVSDRSVRDSVGFPQPGRTFIFGLEGSW